MHTIGLSIVLLVSASQIADKTDAQSETSSSFAASQISSAPSEQAFQKIFGDLERKGQLTPEDYRIAAGQMAELVERFPNSAAALRCVVTAKAWQARDRVPSEILAPILADVTRLNPARDELERLQIITRKATDESDIASIKEVIPQLELIATDHPNTISEYLAKSNLPSLYRQVGQNELALKAAKEFVDRYPPSIASGYPSYSHYQYVNTFQLAAMQAALSVDEALSTYERIAADNPTNPLFGVSALWDAGSLAMQQHRYEMALRYYRQLSSQFSATDDPRIRTAEYKVLEILHLQGNREEGLKIAEELRNRYRDEPYWGAMSDEYIRLFTDSSSQSLSVMAEPKNGSSEIAKSRPGSSWWILPLLNVLILSVLGFGWMARRSRRVK